MQEEVNLSSSQEIGDLDHRSITIHIKEEKRWSQLPTPAGKPGPFIC